MYKSRRSNNWSVAETGQGLVEYALITVLILGLIVCAIIWLIMSQTNNGKQVQRIVFAGKVVNPDSSKWPNNRLVLLFLEGKEIGRNVTTLGEFQQSEQGTHDGLFIIQVDNIYGLSVDGLNRDRNQDSQFAFAEKPGALGFGTFLGGYQFAYLWLDGIAEGSLVHIPVSIKNVSYFIKVLEGDVATLPSELQEPGSATLKDDGTIIVAMKDSIEGQTPNTADVSIKAVNYTVSSETIELNKITVPINNCAGSAAVSQKYVQTQTFVREYQTEAGGSLNFETPLPIWLKLIPELELKYGFKQGQVDTKTIEYDMTVAAQTNLVYIITWQEIWERGQAEIGYVGSSLQVPFRAKTNVIYRVESQSLGCN